MNLSADHELTELEHENALAIDAELADLRAATDTAQGSLHQAEKALRQLTTGNMAWWVELAEGAGGEDAMSEIKTAQRALRNVTRILKEADRG